MTVGDADTSMLLGPIGRGPGHNDGRLFMAEEVERG